MATRWGIASTGNISQDFVRALLSKPDDHNVVAVASRSLDDAQIFAKKFNIKKAYQGYEELAKDPDVEIVYVGTINTTHFKVSSMMLSGGKHVLCEKPLCMNVEETKQLLKLAQKKQLFLMEAIWSRCFPAYEEVKKCIEGKQLGDVVQVMASFGKPISHLPRVSKKELGGGITLDMGIYPIQFAFWIFGCEEPKKILAAGHLGQEGCDESLGLVMLFSNNRTAVLTSNARCDLPNEALVCGTKGTIKIPDFYHPYSYEVNSSKINCPLNTEGDFYYDGSAGLIYEADEARRCLKQGFVESPYVPHKETLMIAQVIEECHRQIGVCHTT